MNHLFKSVHKGNDRPKRKQAIDEGLNLLEKRKVFGPIVRTPNGAKPVAHKWIFI